MANIWLRTFKNSGITTRVMVMSLSKMVQMGEGTQFITRKMVKCGIEMVKTKVKALYYYTEMDEEIQCI